MLQLISMSHLIVRTARIMLDVTMQMFITVSYRVLFELNFTYFMKQHITTTVLSHWQLCYCSKSNVGFRVLL